MKTTVTCQVSPCRHVLHQMRRLFLIVFLTSPGLLLLPEARGASADNTVPESIQDSKQTDDYIKSLVKTIVQEQENRVLHLQDIYINGYRALRLQILNLEDGSQNRESIAFRQFSVVESASMIVEEDNPDHLYVVVAGVPRTETILYNGAGIGFSSTERLHVIKLNITSGELVPTFGDNGMLSLETQFSNSIYEDLFLHKQRLLIISKPYFTPSKLYAIDTNLGKLDQNFGERGLLELGNEQYESFVTSALIAGDNLYIGASFFKAEEKSDSEDYTRSAAKVCKVNLLSGQLENPYNCLTDEVFSAEDFKYKNYIRSLSLLDEESLLVTADERTSLVHFGTSSIVLYLLETKTGELKSHFGKGGRLQLTPKEDRYEVRSVNPANGSLLVTIAKLVPKNTDRTKSPGQAKKDIQVYSLNAKTGAVNKDFGSEGKISLANSEHKRVVISKVVFDASKRRLLVILNHFDEIYKEGSRGNITISAIDAHSGHLQNAFGQQGYQTVTASPGIFYVTSDIYLSKSAGNIYLFGYKAYLDPATKAHPESTMSTIALYPNGTRNVAYPEEVVTIPSSNSDALPSDKEL